MMAFQNKEISRRKFIKTSLIGSGVLTASAYGIPKHFQDKMKDSDQIKVPQRILGRTGEKVSLLGIGCYPFIKKEVSEDDIYNILNRAAELGVNYLDTAPNYGQSAGTFSETKMGPALKDIREKFFLVTKTHEASYDGTWRSLEQSLKRMQTDYLDLVHLHNLGQESSWTDLKEVFGKNGAMGALRKAKEQGVIRYIGASGHQYPSRFHFAINSGEIDVLMLATNFIIQHTYDFEHKVWDRAHKEKIGLVSMKTLGGEQRSRTGQCRIPLDYYDLAIRYTLSLPGLCCAVIGVKDLEQLEMAAEAIATLKPLNKDEADELSYEGLYLSKDREWKAAYGEPTT